MRPIRVTGEAATPQAVADLLSAFPYPDMDTLPLAPVFGGGGGGAPTVVVAASDASLYSQRKADFVCPGASDDITINAAFSAMGGRGRVILTEGTYHCTATVFVGLGGSPGAQQHLYGLGHQISRIVSTAAIAVQVRSAGCAVRHLSVSGGDVGVLSNFAETVLEDIETTDNDFGITIGGALSRVTGCRVSGFEDSGIVASGNDVVIAHCNVNMGSVSVSDGIGIECTGASTVLGNFVQAGSEGFACITVGATQGMVAANRIASGADLIGINVTGDYTTVTGNSIRWGGSATTNGAGIRLNGADNTTVSANSITAAHVGVAFTGSACVNDTVTGNVIAAAVSHGIHIATGSNRITITGNEVISAGGHGIATESANVNSGLTITGNMVYQPGLSGLFLNSVDNADVGDNSIHNPGQAASNTHDGIHVVSCTAATIFSNRVSSSGGGARYGITIESGSNLCVYVGNRTDGTFGTAAYNNAGTGSVNVWPAAGGAQGDNVLT